MRNFKKITSNKLRGRSSAIAISELKKAISICGSVRNLSEKCGFSATLIYSVMNGDYANNVSVELAKSICSSVPGVSYDNLIHREEDTPPYEDDSSLYTSQKHFEDECFTDYFIKKFGSKDEKLGKVIVRPYIFDKIFSTSFKKDLCDIEMSSRMGAKRQFEIIANISLLLDVEMSEAWEIVKSFKVRHLNKISDFDLDQIEG